MRFLVCSIVVFVIYCGFFETIKNTEVFNPLFKKNIRTLTAKLLKYVECPCNLNWPLYLTMKSCRDIFFNVIKRSEQLVEWPPTRTIPENMKEDYTMCGRIPTREYYFSQRYPARTIEWNRSYLQRFKDIASNRQGFNYGDLQKSFYVAFADFVPRGKGVVFGSEEPWAEVLSLLHGADHMLTIEYSKIVTDDERLSSLSPVAAANMFLSGTLPQYDFGVSFSSWEHSGLGRYGDPLDPWGDFEAVQTASCIIKPGGLLYLGVPTGVDKLVWNAHRVYGLIRYPLLTANWLPVAAYLPAGKLSFKGFLNQMSVQSETNHPVLVLKNIRDRKC